jgi:hypothetical protein
MDPFSMYSLITGPAFLRGDERVINAVTRNSYLIPRFLAGKEEAIYLQGGSKIQDIIYLEEESDAEFYDPSKQDFGYRNQQVGTPWEVNWRFLKNATSWTDHEVGLNEYGGFSPTVGKFHRFKRIKYLKEMNLLTTGVHKLEDSLFTTPSFASMEVATGRLPNSLFSTITNRGSGISPYGSTATDTVQGVDAVNRTAWRNQHGTYTVPAGGTIDAENFWDGFRLLYNKCGFERLPLGGEEYSQPKRSPTFITASLWGVRAAERSLRSEQDLLLAGRQDAAFPGPMFHGVPIVYISTLNTATGYWDSTGGVFTNEQGTGANAAFVTGPRFMFVQARVINMVWHSERFLKRLPPFSPDNQPFLKVMVTDTWYNLVNENRRESGVLEPTGIDVAGPAFVA